MNTLATDVTAGLAPTIAGLLSAWAVSADQDWRSDPDRGDHGWYGSGFNAWGVQTVQKHLSAMAVLATSDGIDAALANRCLERSLAALRFTLDSHRSGGRRCADGQSWGHTWISALGLERMMFAVARLDAHLTDDDRIAVDRVLASEAGWQLADLHLGDVHGVVADRWNSSGRNVPESNLWNGALLWRTAARLPDHRDASRWRDRAIDLLINAVSVSADADDDTLMDGVPVRRRHIGANFFDSYALDHHGYLNVGYMVICASNAAMLHFDLRRGHDAAPEALLHHQGELWRAIAPMVSEDGRLLRIGGDSRVRYAYCQEYLLPSLLLAADQFEETRAAPLIRSQLDQMTREQDANGDGSFFGRRLAELRRRSPYYWTRLESDRACALAMTWAHLDLVAWPGTEHHADVPPAVEWVDHDHQAVLVRGPRRFASMSWRSNGLGQGLCLPPDRGDLAEWDLNLSPQIVTEGTPRRASGALTVPLSRELVSATTTTFDGGFVTVGRIAEGADMTIAEGWSGGPAAISAIALAALPDDVTMIGVQRSITGDHHAGILGVKGLHLGIANDVGTGGRRRLETADGTLQLRPGESDQTLPLGRWASVDDVLGVVSLAGPELVLDRSTRRRGGPWGSMHVEEICTTHVDAHRYVGPQEVLVDTTFAVLAGADRGLTRAFADENPSPVLVDGLLRLIAIEDCYLAINLGTDRAAVDLPLPAIDLATGRRLHRVELDGTSGTVLRRCGSPEA